MIELRKYNGIKSYKDEDDAFLVDEVQDDVRVKIGIFFGRAIHLYARGVLTAANHKGMMQYSDYFSNQAVQVCLKYNIVEERPVNEAENKIYQELSTGQGFDKDDREYLKGIHSQTSEKN